MTTHFCPACWTTVGAAATSCPRCHSNLTALDQRSFTTKLVAALHHPEPETRQRAAYILGERRDGAAVQALGEILLTTSEPFFACEIVAALGKIGGREAETLLLRALDHKAFLVRLAALQVLGHAGDAAAAALQRAARDASPSVRRLARELGARRRPSGERHGTRGV
jgi:HEAT repeat protein